MQIEERAYLIPEGCICMGDGLLGMRCDSDKHPVEVKRGDRVLGLDPHTRKWRPAILREHKPYYSRGQLISDGWYVGWTDLAEASASDPHYSPSSGGWLSVNCLKVLEDECKSKTEN